MSDHYNDEMPDSQFTKWAHPKSKLVPSYRSTSGGGQWNVPMYGREHQPDIHYSELAAGSNVNSATSSLADTLSRMISESPSVKALVLDGNDYTLMGQLNKLSALTAEFHMARIFNPETDGVNYDERRQPNGLSTTRRFKRIDEELSYTTPLRQEIVETRRGAIKLAEEHNMGKEMKEAIELLSSAAITVMGDIGEGKELKNFPSPHGPLAEVPVRTFRR